jgi:hypothetical protein
MYIGGKISTSKGYVLISGHSDHPNAQKSGYILEHIYIMAEYLGRALYKGETVNHINGNRQDNRLENLQLRVGQHGLGQPYICSDCGSDRIEAVPIADEEIDRSENVSRGRVADSCS